MEGNKGQVSVFLCIIFMAVFIVAGILIDAARIISGKSQVERAAANAARSLLADYSTSIKEQYGIFAINNNWEKDLNNIAREYLEKNLSIGIEELQNINIYNFKVEKVSVTPIFNLTEDQTVKNQILEYMKYYAPEQVIENLWQKISMIRDAGKIADTYNRKLNLDKQCGQIGELLQRLKEKISGTIGNGIIQEYFINKFDKDGIRSSAIENYAEVIIRQSALNKELNAAYELVGKKENKINANNSKEEAGPLKEELAILQDKIGSIKDELDTLENERDSLENRLKGELTGKYLEINKEAKQIIDDITEAEKKAAAEIEDFEGYLGDGYADPHSSYDNFLESIKEDIGYLKDIVLNGEKTEELLQNIEKNIAYLETAMERLNQACQLDWQNIDPDLGKEWVISLLSEGFGNYINSLEFDYKTAGNPVPGEDPREGKDRETEEILKKDVEDISIEDINTEGAGININELPSRNKHYSEDSSAFEGRLDDLPGEIDINHNDSRFIDKTFNYMRNMGNFFTGDFKDFMDDIYINEYIMKVFNNHVSAQKGKTAEDNSTSSTNLDNNYNNNNSNDNDNSISNNLNNINIDSDNSINNNSLKNRNSFFNGEVEYILHGDSSERINKMKTKAQILLIRFAMNTLHAYFDSNKRELAKGIAAAVSGWWTAGACIPIISNLILCGWGLGEALIDLEDLLEGKAVPFYKLKGDWKLGVGSIFHQNSESDEESPSLRSDPKLMFDYNDYLRIFLMLVNTEKKIGRIEDLIELNGRKADSGFRAANCSTYLKIEAEVSLNYLFLTRVFIPGNKKTREGRHCFKVMLYEGY